MARGFILVNDLLVGDRIEYFGGLLQNAAGSRFVACFDRFAYALDRTAQLRAQAGIVAPTLLALPRGFSCGCYIGHVVYPAHLKKGAIIRIFVCFCNKNHRLMPNFRQYLPLPPQTS